MTAGRLVTSGSCAANSAGGAPGQGATAGNGKGDDYPKELHQPKAAVDAANASQGQKATQTSTALDAGKLGNGLYELLTEAGYENAEQVAGATDQQLLDLHGVGPASLAEIRAVYPANAPQGE